MAFSNRVFLDTNMLLSIFRFRVNLEEQLSELLGEHELAITESVMGELENMHSPYARAAISFAMERCAKVASELNEADDDLLLVAVGAVIATNDRELRRRAEKIGIRTIFLRERKKLEMK